MEIFYLYLPLFLALYMITKHFLGKIRNLPPTPILNFPVLGHLYLLKKPILRSLAHISDRYGPVLLLDFGSRPVLLISSPSAVEECLGKHDVNFANRPDLLAGKYLGYDYTSIVWLPYGERWRNLRKISSLELLSSRRLQMLQGIRADEVRMMLRRFYLASRANRSVEANTVFFEMMLNVMMRMISGKRYYGEVVEEEQVKRFREIMEETIRIAGASNLADFLPVLRRLKLDKLDSRLRALREMRDGFMQDLIEEVKIKSHEMSTGDDAKNNGREKQRNFIEVMLALQEEEPQLYTDEIIKSLMLALLGAGTDSSAGAMEWALSLLLNNPSYLKRAREEIDNVVGKNRFVDESDVINLPFLRCIVHETLRMYPVTPLFPHQSSQECVVGGYRVPQGTMLIVNLWAIQNDPKIWADPRKFKPERFEGINEVSKDYGYKWMPFGSGRRGCPAEGLAMRMVGFALGSIIQCFDWERVGKEMVDMTEDLGLALFKVQPLIANCRPRLEMMHLLEQI